MRKVFLAFLVLLAALACLMDRPSAAQESVTLTTPVAQPSVSTMTLERVTLNVAQNTILVEWRNNAGVLQAKWYDSTTVPTGATLLHQLNIGNFSVNSLVKQIYNRLLTDGAIAPGTIGGSPQ